MKKFFFLVAALCALLPSLSLAAEPFDFAAIAIDAMSDFRDVWHVPQLSATASLSETMQKAVAQKEAFRNIQQKFRPFANSSDKGLRASADGLSQLYGLFEQNATNVADDLEATLNNPKEVSKALGSATRKAYERTEQSKRSWALYTKNAMPLVLTGLVKTEGEPEDQPAHTFKLTKYEWEEL